MGRSIERVLVANRGEIAVRVMRAATELGIRTIAMYTAADRESIHRVKADESYEIGDPARPLAGYLDVDEVDAARCSWARRSHLLRGVAGQGHGSRS